MQFNIRKIRGKEFKNCFDLMGDLFYFMTFVYLFPYAFVGKICMWLNRKCTDMPKSVLFARMCQRNLDFSCYQLEFTTTSLLIV